MTLIHKTLGVAAAIIALATAAIAHEGIHIEEPYARVSSETAKSGAIFLHIVNHGTTDERLVSVASDVAERAELHTHIEDANGVMQMREIEGGIIIPGSGDHVLGRSGDHIMLLGLTRPLRQGDVVKVTLTFEKEGEMTIDVPVDNERAPEMAMPHAHGGATN